MSARRDVVVIGAGHNGLTTAVLLAQRGHKVVLVERHDGIGGMAAAEEFHPGYRSAGVLVGSGGVGAGMLRELGLDRHGLRMRAEPPGLLALGAGASLWVHRDARRGAAEIAKHSPADAEHYAGYRALHRRMKPVLRDFLERSPLDLLDLESAPALEVIRRALRIRRLGRRDMMELLRLPPMSVADGLDEWFETGLLKAALALPALAGSFLGPRSPGSNANLLLVDAATGPGVMGDGPALVAALERRAVELGVEIRCGVPVGGIRVENGRARGVTLEDGTNLDASVVAASCDPKQTLLRLLPPGSLSARAESQVRSFRTRGLTAQVLLAVSGPPSFEGQNGSAVEYARTGSRLDDLERAFDAVKYRSIAETPILDIHVPTVSSPHLAPEGHAVISVLVHYVPHDLEGGWDDARRQRLGDGVVSILERYVPGLSHSVVGREVRTPVDLERRYGTWEGHLCHGEQGLDQMLIRPAPPCSRYATPVEGLFLCGSGSHPGGGLTCLPGSLAARAILSA